MTTASEALEVIAQGFNPAEFRIRAIKAVRQMTGLGLKEAKDAVDEYAAKADAAAEGDGGEEMSLEEILADLQRKEGREQPSTLEKVRAGYHAGAYVREDPKERRRARDRERQRQLRAAKKALDEAEGVVKTAYSDLQDEEVAENLELSEQAESKATTTLIWALMDRLVGTSHSLAEIYKVLEHCGFNLHLEYVGKS